jgi:hypothetical protein
MQEIRIIEFFLENWQFIMGEKSINCDVPAVI